MRKMAFTAGSRRRTIVISGCKAFIYVKSSRKHIAQNHRHDIHCTRCKRGLCIGLQHGNRDNMCKDGQVFDPQKGECRDNIT